MTAPHTYITTTIPYVNARPHIGFALELVQADVLARYRRGCGDAVRFQAGTDDNSLKNVLAAEAAGVEHGARGFRLPPGDGRGLGHRGRGEPFRQPDPPLGAG